MDSEDEDPDSETEAAPGNSVFGDDAGHASGASVFGDEGAESGAVDYGSASSSSPGFDTPLESIFSSDQESGQQSVFGGPDESPSVKLGPEGDAVDVSSSDSWRSSRDALDDVASGGDHTVALNVDTPEGDDLDAWSELSDSTPKWGEGEPDETWDPGPAPGTKEPAKVEIGEQSERFFTYDDDGGGGYIDDGFVDDGPSGGRDMQSALITGIALLAIALIALNIGPLVALGLVVVVVALSAGEFFNALRVAGYQPATLLGLAASVAMPLAVYWRGLQAVPLVLALSVIFGLLWFLAGVSTDTPVMNLGVTLLGITYVGVLGSFGAAMLELGERVVDDHGTGLLLAAIIVTIGYDVGAFFAGRSFGRTPLTSVSPNKTVEGLIGGAIASLIVAVVVFGMLEVIAPFGETAAGGGFIEAVLLGLVGAIVAPLGDLGESLIKRDLGIKDMGSILPGHGGFLDRFDALLFVLPAVYYLAETVIYN